MDFHARPSSLLRCRSAHESSLSYALKPLEAQEPASVRDPEASGHAAPLCFVASGIMASSLRGSCTSRRKTAPTTRVRLRYRLRAAAGERRARPDRPPPPHAPGRGPGCGKERSHNSFCCGSVLVRKHGLSLRVGRPRRSRQPCSCPRRPISRTSPKVHISR
jgi:hypothetical protein